MIVLALLFVVAGVGLALAANVARRALQTRFALGGVAALAGVAALPTLWLVGPVSLAGSAVALVAALGALRAAGTREDDSLDRMQGALIGLAVFHALVMVVGALGFYLTRGGGI